MKNKNELSSFQKMVIDIFSVGVGVTLCFHDAHLLLGCVLMLAAPSLVLLEMDWELFIRSVTNIQ